jgi:futalosine hydrolase
MIELETKGHLLILSAVDAETDIIVKTMTPGETKTIGRRKVVFGRLAGKEAAVLVTGPGVVNTAQAMGAVLEHIRPSLIIQCGCAGIFKETAGTVGDVGIAVRETDLHSGIEPAPQDDPVPSPLPFALLETSGGPVSGTYPMDMGLVEKAYEILKKAFENHGPRVFKGPFITVSTITATDERAEKLAHSLNPVMESMEGSAAAHVAADHGIPFLEIRSASNIVGKRERNTWDLPQAFKNSSAAVIHLSANIKTGRTET